MDVTRSEKGAALRQNRSRARHNPRGAEQGIKSGTNRSQWLAAFCSNQVNHADYENAHAPQSDSPVASVDTEEETDKTRGQERDDEDTQNDRLHSTELSASQHDVKLSL